MSEQQQIDAPILTYLTHAAQEAGKAIAATDRETAHDRRLRALDEEIARLTEQRKKVAEQYAKAGNDRELALRHAAMHRDAAAYLAQQTGLDPKKVLAVEPAPIPPAQDTPSPPSEPGPNDTRRWGRATCRCNQVIVRGLGELWVHATNDSRCDPSNPDSPLAEPQIDAADPLGLDRTGALPLPPKEVAR